MAILYARIHLVIVAIIRTALASGAGVSEAYSRLKRALSLSDF